MSDLLLKLNMPSFVPFPLFKTGVQQTIAARYYPYRTHIDNSILHSVTLSDGDKIVLVENTPIHIQPMTRSILLIHGLTGSNQSCYLLRLTRRFVKQGYRVFRMNLRGCGLGAKLAKQIYHSGRSDDPRTVLKYLANLYPHSPVTQIGFSIGANITLKMAGEDGPERSGNCDSIIAVSPPLDLKASVKLITHPLNTIFDQRFVKDLVKHAYDLHRWYPETPLPVFPKKLNLYEFDNCYTSVRAGFKDANDYYEKNSSIHFLPSIELPAFILHARDDPFISRRTLAQIPQKENLQNQKLDVLITKQGGHVGWLGQSSKRGDLRWMDDIIVKWVNWHNNQTTSLFK